MCWWPAKDPGLRDQGPDRAGRNITFGTTGVGTGSQLAQKVLFKQANVEEPTSPRQWKARPHRRPRQSGGSHHHPARRSHDPDQGRQDHAVARFSEQRNSFLPDVPTAKESGFDVPVAQYRAVAAPKGTPRK